MPSVTNMPAFDMFRQRLMAQQPAQTAQPAPMMGMQPAPGMISGISPQQLQAYNAGQPQQMQAYNPGMPRPMPMYGSPRMGDGDARMGMPRMGDGDARSNMFQPQGPMAYNMGMRY